MTSFVVNAGTTDTTAKTVGNNETGTIQSGGTLSAATAVTWTGGTTKIDNSGVISATTRGIDTTGSFATGSLTFNNFSGARLIASGNDGVRINTNVTNGTITVNNSGLIVSGAVDNANTITPRSSGQAIDFATITSPNAIINITNNAGGVIGASGDDAIRPGAGHVTIVNSGLIDATASASRAINLNTSNLTNVPEFHLINNAGGTIQSQGDTVRITATTLSPTATGTFSVDNSGTIKSTGTGVNNGQAIDFNDLVSPLGAVTIVNHVGGLIQAADADAIRPGVNATVTNYGQIVSLNATAQSTGNDGIDFQANGGGTVHNGDAATPDALISGARHGITGDKPVTVDNWGTIKGNSGSGINLDTASATTTSVTNHGTIVGTSVNSDGDGVDIDGLIKLDNYGTIQATGVHIDDNRQEALAIGGGTVNNYAGGVITSFERAITVDDSNLGNAFAAVTINNEGKIEGGNGEAISIAGTFADTITNKGQIIGGVFTDGGDDTFNAYTGSSVSGLIDGGDGNDTIYLYATTDSTATGTLGAVANVEQLNVDGGAWTLTHEATFSAGAAIAAGASLQVGDGSTTGALIADVANNGALIFDRSDSVTFAGHISGAGVVEQIGTGTLVLSGHNDYTGGTQVFAGVLEVATADGAGTGAITFETGAQTVKLDAPAYASGHVANQIDHFDFSDAIDLADFGSSTGATLGAGNLMTVNQSSGHAVTIQFSAADDFNGDLFMVASDGAGGTTLTVAAAQHVGAPGYTIGGSGADVVALSGSGVVYAAGGGNDYVVMSNAGGSVNGQAGNDTIVGGAGKDVITGGTGADMVTGGAGADTFIFNKGDIADANLTGGKFDVITDFEGAGNGYVAGAGDLIRFQGFSAAATLTHTSDVAGHTDQHIYEVTDGTYHAQFVIQYAANVGSNLVKGDYGFYA